MVHCSICYKWLSGATQVTRTVHGLAIDRGLFPNQEVYQEEPKEEPVYDIVLPNSTSYVYSIAGGKGVVIEQEWQSS